MHLEELTEQVSRHVSAPRLGRQRADQPMPGLWLLWRAAPSSLETSLYEAVICLILRGRKQVSVGEQTLSFGPGECLLVSHDLPVRSQITVAPYLALVFAVDLATIRGLHDELTEKDLEREAESQGHGDGDGDSEGDSEGDAEGERARATATCRADPGLLESLRRYLALSDSPADAKVLGPLVSKELHYRLLTAPFGGMLRNLIRHDSNASAITRAIAHIRGDLRSPVAVPELARKVGMSASSFHKYFKAITATTPLQYQKELRLLEARRLLKTSAASVSTAAFEVGYESPSQFSREYARKFGVPPSRDLSSECG